ncbi:hypothetical protein [Photobacterium leiognathi]|uniref:hypothetical protein n=1 Tax=Photobacterium leiognathi TaxID=553611 RepID=UPI002981315C|nr:hypothetical protein [Photobacterium leiognathi]
MIVTKDDYHKAMARIDALTKGDPDALPDDLFRELDALTRQVEAYENIHCKL